VKDKLITWLLLRILNKLEIIMVTQADEVLALQALAAQLSKALTEIMNALSNQPNATPELVQAVDALKPIAQALDDLNPDPVV